MDEEFLNNLYIGPPEKRGIYNPTQAGVSVSIGNSGKELSTALVLANWNSGHNTEVCLH